MKLLLTFLLMCILFSISRAQENCTEYPEESIFENISAEQALDTINAYVDKNWFVILDVRTSNEYNGGHIEEGVNIVYGTLNFSDEIAALDRDKIYLVYCASGARSGQTYNLMQSLDFHRVYNMSGGLNSWNTQSYPTTTDVSAIGSSCITDIEFEELEVGSFETVELKITNAGNDTLKIESITDLTGTEFSTDFDTEIELFGSFDYSFNVTYTPENDGIDSEIFTITTNVGTIDFYISGSADYPTFNELQFTEEIKVTNDYGFKQIIIKGGERGNFNLYNSSGQLCKSGNLSSDSKISYSDLSNGIYILQILRGIESKVIKLSL
jgi:rhodanese-related sulfurtransferase